METNQYLDILKKAFFISWKNKFLWFFGFLILVSTLSSNLNVDNDAIPSQNTNHQLLIFIQNNQKLASLAGLSFFLIWIGLFLLKIMGTTAIIKSVNNIALYRQLSIKNILFETKKYLSRLLLLEIIIFVIMLMILIILAVPVVYLFAIKAKIFAIIVLIMAFFILLPLLILSFYLGRYASYSIILIDNNVSTSLEMAYAIFSKNIKKSLSMGVIFLVFSLILIIGSSLMLIVGSAIYAALGNLSYWVFIKISASILSLVLVIMFFSWYLVFLHTSWLLFFQQISFEKTKNEKKEVESKEEIKSTEPETA